MVIDMIQHTNKHILNIVTNIITRAKQEIRDASNNGYIFINNKRVI